MWLKLHFGISSWNGTTIATSLNLWMCRRAKRERERGRVWWDGVREREKRLKPHSFTALPSLKAHSARWWFLFLSSTLGFVYAFREPDKIRIFHFSFFVCGCGFSPFHIIFSSFIWRFLLAVSECVCSVFWQSCPLFVALMHGQTFYIWWNGTRFEVKGEKKLKTSQVLSTTHCSRCDFIWNSSQPTKKLVRQRVVGIGDTRFYR